MKSPSSHAQEGCSESWGEVGIVSRRSAGGAQTAIANFYLDRSVPMQALRNAAARCRAVDLDQGGRNSRDQRSGMTERRFDWIEIACFISIALTLVALVVLFSGLMEPSSS